MTRRTRLIPIALILCAAVVGALFLRERLSFEALAENREALLAYRDAHFLSASLIVLFVVVHLVMVAVSGPLNSLRSMITGWYRLPQERADG